MKWRVRFFVAVLWACIPLRLLAAELEIIPLQFRTAEQLLPVLRPLLEPGATLSGSGEQLFLRASPKTRQAIRSALVTLDVPARNLLIEITDDRQIVQGAAGMKGEGRAISGGAPRAVVSASVWDTRALQRSGLNQRLQVVEGARAFIRLGSSFPLAVWQTVIGPQGVIVGEKRVWRDLGQGFHAEARLTKGNRVTVEFLQEHEQRDRLALVQTERFSTRISGQLGEWIELVGQAARESQQETGGFNVSSRDVQRTQVLWLRVSLADPGRINDNTSREGKQ